MNLTALPARELGTSQLQPTFEVVDTVDGFDQLRDAWDALFEASGLSPFQSFEYQRTWWSVFGDSTPGARLHILVARSADQVVAITPLFIETAKTVGSGSLRRLAFIGRGDSDYLDLLVAKGSEACLDGIASHLANDARKFDVLALEDISDRSSTHALLGAAFDRLGLPHVRFVNELCPRTELQDTWERTLSAFKTDTRREIRRRERNLRKSFAVDLELVEKAEDVEPGIDAFIAMHQNRWNRAGHTGAFADPRVGELHRRLAPLFFRRGWLFLAFLRLDGRRMVANYCFRFRGELAIFLGGAADLGDAWRLSPGRVLTGLCMQEAVKEGLRTYDFMRGVEDYKYEFDALGVPNWTILLYSPAARLAKARYKVALLRSALRRRLDRERFLCRMVAQEHGLWSGGMLRHVRARLRSFVLDGIMKVRAPERSLACPSPGSFQDKSANSPTPGQ